MMWTDTTMDKPSMSKAKVGNNYATLYNTNSLLVDGFLVKLYAYFFYKKIIEKNNLIK